MRNAEWPSHVSFIDRSWRIPHSPAPFEHDRAKRKARWSKRQGFADARHRDFGRIALEPVENGGEGRLRRRYHVERDNHSQSLSAKVLPNIGAKFTMKEAAPSGDVPRGRWHSPDLNLLYLKEVELAKSEKVEQLFFKDVLSTLDTTGITAEEIQHRWSKRGCPLDSHHGRRGFLATARSLILAPEQSCRTGASRRAISSIRED
jgi:hypothetical protein